MSYLRTGDNTVSRFLRITLSPGFNPNNIPSGTTQDPDSLADIITYHVVFGSPEYCEELPQHHHISLKDSSAAMLGGNRHLGGGVRRASPYPGSI